MERKTYSVELTSFEPIKIVGIATYIHVPGNPSYARGGNSYWNTCGHHHKTWEAAVSCAEKIARREEIPLPEHIL